MDTTTSYTETEERIFDAAIQVFARKGKGGARMQEIADAAQINKAMLHYYFRSKDKLYDAVFAFALHRFLDSFAERLQEEAPFEEWLRWFIDGYIDHIGTNLDLMRVMVSENLNGGGAFGTHLRRLVDEGMVSPPRLFMLKVAEAGAQGHIRPMDPFNVLLSTISCCLFFFIMRPTVSRMNPAAEADWDAFVEARKQHVFDLMYHGLKPKNDA